MKHSRAGNVSGSTLRLWALYEPSVEIASSGASKEPFWKSEPRCPAAAARPGVGPEGSDSERIDSDSLQVGRLRPGPGLLPVTARPHHLLSGSRVHWQPGGRSAGRCASDAGGGVRVVWHDSDPRQG